MSEKQQQARRKRSAREMAKKRKILWPEVQDEQLWDKYASIGYFSAPRTLPLVMRILDMLSSGKPLSGVYLSLWSRLFDESVVRVVNENELAVESGFLSGRGTRTWGERVDVLEELGFISVNRALGGSRAYVLVFNPYKVLEEKIASGVIRNADVLSLWDALKLRAAEIGATEQEGG